jgi:NAD(P)H-quinone oxidoreductase subunit 5
MLSAFLWLAALGPLSLAGVGVIPVGSGRRAASRAGKIGIAASLVALTVAFFVALNVALQGPLRTPLLGANGIGFALYFDALSATMFCLVSFIGLIVVKYSRNYLDGDPRQVRFTRLLCLTLAAVLLVIAAGNVFAFTLAWIAMSLGLHELLLFYRERPAATLAARKEWLASRFGDLCLIAAMVLLFRRFGSLDYTVLFSGADALRGATAFPASMHAVALLLVCTAMVKSAQFPLHGWLIEVMETPTPVSALLHAGIINAGGFLVLRFSHVIALSLPSLETLMLVGGFTALFGSVVMLTQTSIKASLAHSTIAQMGFMMLECGLGAFPAALLHIVAHSLYKAHAFLSSGSVIDIARASWTPSPGGKPHPARLICAIAAVLAIAVVFGSLFGVTLTEQPGAFALGAALLLGLVHLVAKSIDEQPSFFVIGRTVAAAVLVAVSYFGLHFAVEHLYAGVFPTNEVLRDPLGTAVVVVVIGSFAIVTFLQGYAPSEAGTARWQALYAHVSNGLYVNTFANRLLLRFWPIAPAPSASAATLKS